MGTLVNVLAVVLGSLVGIFVKGGMPDNIQKIISQAIGLATIFIGIAGAMSGQLVVKGGVLVSTDTIILIFSLIIGAVIGEIIDVEEKLTRFGDFLKNKMTKNIFGDSTFAEGFVTASLVYCVGAMAIVGAFNDGLLADHSVLFAKSVLDGTISIVFAANLGIGVMFSALAVLIYQGGLTLMSGLIAPYLTEQIITRMSLVGSVLIFCIGINFIFGKKVKVGNFIFSMFIPILLTFMGM